MKKIDHIGIAVKDVEASNELFSKLFNKAPFHQELLETQHLQVSFFALEDTKVELIQPVSEKSTVHKYLENKGEGIHHIAFEVADMLAAGWPPPPMRTAKAATSMSASSGKWRGRCSAMQVAQCAAVERIRMRRCQHCGQGWLRCGTRTKMLALHLLR